MLLKLYKNTKICLLKGPEFLSLKIQDIIKVTESLTYNIHSTCRVVVVVILFKKENTLIISCIYILRAACKRILNVMHTIFNTILYLTLTTYLKFAVVHILQCKIISLYKKKVKSFQHLLPMRYNVS